MNKSTIRTRLAGAYYVIGMPSPKLRRAMKLIADRYGGLCMQENIYNNIYSFAVEAEPLPTQTLAEQIKARARESASEKLAMLTKASGELFVIAQSCIPPSTLECITDRSHIIAAIHDGEVTSEAFFEKDPERGVILRRIRSHNDPDEAMRRYMIGVRTLLALEGFTQSELGDIARLDTSDRRSEQELADELELIIKKSTADKEVNKQT